MPPLAAIRKPTSSCWSSSTRRTNDAQLQRWARDRSVLAEPLRDVRVGVDAPVAEERPAGAHRIDLGEIDLLDEHDLAIHGRAHEDASVGAGDEALAPELDAARAARVRLESRAVHGDHEAAVRDGMPALHGLPGPMLALAVLRLFLGMPADRRRIDEDLGALHRREPRGFRVPLVPADEHAELHGLGVEDFEAEIARREVILLVIARVVGDVHLAVLAEVAALRVDDGRRVVIQAGRAFLEQARDERDLELRRE